LTYIQVGCCEEVSPIDRIETAYYSGSGSSGIPTINYELTASVFPEAQFRGYYANLTINLTNKEKNSEMHDFSFEGFLFPSYRIVKASDQNSYNMSFNNISDFSESGAHFKISSRSLGPKKSKLFNYTIYIVNTANLGQQKIINPLTSQIEFEHKGLQVIQPLAPSLLIFNNNPLINLSVMTLLKNEVIVIDDNTLMLVDNNAANYASLDLNASDKEDKSLNYSLVAIGVDNNKRNYGNSTKVILLNGTNSTFALEGLTKGEHYRFRARAVDSDNGYFERDTSLLYENKIYKILFVPNEGDYEILSIILSLIITTGFTILLLILRPRNKIILDILYRNERGIFIFILIAWIFLPIIYYLLSLNGILILSIISTLIACSLMLISIFIYRQFSSKVELLVNMKFVGAIIFLIWFIYILFLRLNPINLPFLTSYVGNAFFFNSMPFFYLIIYFTIFLLVLCFNEICFSVEGDGLTKELRFINSAIMLLVLICLTIFIPRNSSYIVEHLHYY
jgi:hypothetical protein